MNKKRFFMLASMLLLAGMLFKTSIVNVKAECDHNWVYDADYYSINDKQHEIALVCLKCDEIKYETEDHILDEDWVTSEGATKNYHYRVNECYVCGYQKKVKEDHTWKKDFVCYNMFDDLHHEIVTTYACECGNYKDVITKGKHSYAWKKYGSVYWYECKKCQYGNEWTQNTVYSGTLKCKKKYYLRVPCEKHDKLKSVKVTKGSKLIKIGKKTNKKVAITCKKKGSVRVQVKMKSGATYTYKYKIK